MAMTKIDSQIDARIAWIRPILNEFSELDIKDNARILYYLRLLYQGQYIRGDLMYIPTAVSSAFMFNMHICFMYLESREEKTYSGEVSVIQRGKWFKFNFIMDGVQYEFVQSELTPKPDLNHSNMNVLFDNALGSTWCKQLVALKSYTIDYY